MAYFPFYVEVENKKCLLIGGGIVALRKLEVLLSFGPVFHVVAPEIEDEIIEMSKRHSDKIRLSKRKFMDSDLDDADFVVAASADDELNRHIFITCEERKIPVNVVDVKEECSFILPAIIHNDSFTIAVSSGGKSPAAAKYLKQCIRDAVPENYECLIEDLGDCRDYVKQEIPDQRIRGTVFQELLDAGLENDCSLTKEIIEAIVAKYK